MIRLYPLNVIIMVKIALKHDERALFDIPDDVVYLNCANMSPQLRTVTDAGRRAVETKRSPWTLATRDWFAPSEDLRALVGRILHAEADDIALVPAASYGVAVAAANMTASRGQSILVLDQEFPSNVYAWRALAERTGARVRMVRRDAGTTWTDSILSDIGDDTAVVAVPHCHWIDGTLVDLERVGARARAVGSALVVDASQSLGALPIDVRAVQPDFLVSVGYKWLLGPYGLGYVYAGRRYRESGRPLEYSWLSRDGSDDFARLVEYTDAMRPGARRFDAGEYPQFCLTPMAIAALTQVLAWGVEHIQARLTSLMASFESAIAELGDWTLPDAERAGHISAISRVGPLPERLVEDLAAAKVFVSRRGDRIRISPHLYNDVQDVQVLVDILRSGGNR
jgi:selenocysteine lyase/cysteine desulfurase